MHLMPHVRGSALLLLFLVSCGGGDAGAPPPPFSGDQLRVLFVGNSLTHDNDLPAMASQVAASLDAPPMVVGRVIRGGFSLGDHWAEGTAQGMIRQGTWDVVVLQQGPSALPESQAGLLASTRQFADLAEQHGARVALLMVWPESNRPAARDSVRMSYTNAAAAVDGILVPAGEAWRAAWRRDAALALYSSDGFHPAPMGSYLAALSLVEQLYGRSSIGASGLGIDPAQVALLQESAAEADAAFGRR
jgi:hypothetical protein